MPEPAHPHEHSSWIVHADAHKHSPSELCSGCVAGDLKFWGLGAGGVRTGPFGVQNSAMTALSACRGALAGFRFSQSVREVHAAGRRPAEHCVGYHAGVFGQSDWSCGFLAFTRQVAAAGSTDAVVGISPRPANWFVSCRTAVRPRKNGLEYVPRTRRRRRRPSPRARRRLEFSWKAKTSPPRPPPRERRLARQSNCLALDDLLRKEGVLARRPGNPSASNCSMHCSIDLSSQVPPMLRGRALNGIPAFCIAGK